MIFRWFRIFSLHHNYFLASIVSKSCNNRANHSNWGADGSLHWTWFKFRKLTLKTTYITLTIWKRKNVIQFYKIMNKLFCNLSFARRYIFPFTVCCNWNVEKQNTKLMNFIRLMKMTNRRKFQIKAFSQKSWCIFSDIIESKWIIYSNSFSISIGLSYLMTTCVRRLVLISISREQSVFVQIMSII